ncbi:ferredoxin--NADP reductase [Amycolatopsis sp. K13G38]|uniref:Ferredoxin--NADP reductase n=1 Tax=Amycolatopsis acididurans TaxID=2724524 RepID=A0ABX1IVG7_9PSEU|nr:ferredoxin--NADP reductase [Amycolatopsis acididurans]NKQ51480.1 ferredoxin--NADP reductase [Amycolatopsis acididurans]
MADHNDVRWEHGYHPLRVRKIVRETADTSSYVLDVTEELRELFRYRPGQFCTFRVRIGDRELLRSYSMSSAPGIDADLTVTVKRVPEGTVSNWFNDTVSEGDVLEATKPGGVFCPREGDHPVVAFCGGSGITPVLSIAKHVLARTERAVRLFYANRDAGSVIFDEELRRLGERYPGRLRVVRHYDAESGHPDKTAVTGFVGAEVNAEFYICGPAPFMELVEHSLLGLGIAPARILIERFGDGGPAEDSAGDGQRETPESVTIILNGKKQTVPYQPGDTVLETARRGGMQPPFSCEAGNCATCMGLLRAGSATMRANNALEPDEVAEGWILTCQALPEGPEPLTVEYEAF